MPFTASDRANLVKHLNLHKDQAKSTSWLAELMKEAETFDTDNSTTYVTNIQAALASISALDTEIRDVSEDDGIKRTDIDGFHEVERFAAGGATSHLKNQRQGHINTIWRSLDPDQLLRQHVVSDRVIRTL